MVAIPTATESGADGTAHNFPTSLASTFRRHPFLSRLTCSVASPSSPASGKIARHERKNTIASEK
eukprot:scaffold17768_cov31-Tisochrysis_lutea.AAC.12